MSAITARGRAKAERSDALRHAAAQLFAERGYTDVSLDEIGQAAGVSGPAVYRHFHGKQALLGEVLVKVSDDLLAGGQEVIERITEARARMRALVDFHVAFALSNSDVIRVQDRDLAHLSENDRSEVRRLQRGYIDLWVDSLTALRTGSAEEQRLRVQACFGLINSTPHSTRRSTREDTTAARILQEMAFAALLSGAQGASAHPIAQ